MEWPLKWLMAYLWGSCWHVFQDCGKKNRIVFFSFGVKMYWNYRLLLRTIFQPWAFCLRCCCLLFWKGLWSQASHHNFCVHYRTFPELESIRLPVPAAVAAAAHFIDLFGNLFSAARLLQIKPFSSDSFDFQPNFILYSCRRPTWPHLCVVCLATYNGPQTLLRARGCVSGLYVNTQLNHTGR